MQDYSSGEKSALAREAIHTCVSPKLRTFETQFKHRRSLFNEFYSTAQATTTFRLKTLFM